MTTTLVRLVKLSISLIYMLFIWILDVASPLFFYKRKPKIVVLYYHGVTESEIERFNWQMNDLLRWSVPISLNSENVFNKTIYKY